jgi:hypothetical protein
METSPLSCQPSFVGNGSGIRAPVDWKDGENLFAVTAMLVYLISLITTWQHHQTHAAWCHQIRNFNSWHLVPVYEGTGQGKPETLAKNRSAAIQFRGEPQRSSFELIPDPL